MVGKTIAHYQILEKLGEGGMGVVYKARDTHLDRFVAIKVLPPERVADPERKQRFVLEAKAASALNHPNIITIHDISSASGVDFIAMEYVAGQTLARLIPRDGMPLEKALTYALGITDALARAHQAGVIHRDLKPGNIMVDEHELVKLLDFGLAKLTERVPTGEATEAETATARETPLTEAGTVLGTVAYMSPEQVEGKGLDARSDVFSFGAVLYEMLTGRRPFRGDSPVSTMSAILRDPPPPPRAVRPEIPAELNRILFRCLDKNREARYQSGAELHRDLAACQSRLAAQRVGFRAFLRKPLLAIPALVCVALLCVAGAWFLHRQRKIRWARETALPEIERLVASTEVGLANMLKAYALAVDAERYIPADPVLARLLERCSSTISITTEPPGAAVSMKAFSAAEDQWKYVGISPVERLRAPRGYFWWKLERDGYERVMAVGRNVRRVLDPKGKIPPGMTRVPGAKTDVGQIDDFFIDRYEVTNKQYQEFVDRGGYREVKYWKHKFMKEGRQLSWQEAMAGFVDQTGRPGPSTWQAGEYSKGQDDYPVSGVSWYEAAAFAEYTGKSLPTLYHWGVAAGEAGSPGANPLVGWLPYVSNFKGEGPAPVGSFRSMTAYGAFDMPGNVREWCWNETRGGKVLRGGAWNDAAYMMNEITQAAAFDRSPKNGFRCVLLPDPRSIPDKAFEAFEVLSRDFRGQTPVPDSIFRVYKEQFAYDKRDLNTRVDWRNEDSPHWVQEKATVDAAYGSERLPIYVFLPKRSSPPYQTVIYFPGSGPADQASSKNLDSDREFEQRLAFVIKTGRAVAYPVYKGTFERREDALAAINSGAPTRQFSEYAAQLVKDFKRSVDYLETRSDIDGKKLAYLGFSWGGRMAPLVLATEDRLHVAVVVVGGMRANVRPESNYLNYVPRVKVPVLMLNGRYDMFFPFDTTVKPMFDLLGTPAEHKRLRVYETDHFIPQTDCIRETLAWLDRYLGPVK